MEKLRIYALVGLMMLATVAWLGFLLYEAWALAFGS
jgi:hypothetical protein